MFSGNKPAVLAVPWLAPYINPQGDIYAPNGNLPKSVSLAPVEDARTTNILDLKSATSTVNPQNFAWVSSRSITSVAPGDGALFLEAQNTLRNFLFLRNASATAKIYIEFGRQADASSAVVIVPGQSMLFDTVVPQDDLYFYADAATGILRFAFSTIGDR